MAKAGKTYVSRDPRPLSQAVVLWLHLRAASSALSVGSDLFQLHGLSRLSADTPVSMSETLPGMEAADLVTALTSLLLVVTILVSGVLTLKWIYRVTMNSHTLADGVRNSPPWSVGWFFIPFANLYKPFQSIADAWKISQDPQGWRGLETPSLLRWWWGLWLATTLLDNASFRLQMRSHDVGMTRFTTGLDLVSDLLWIPLCLLLVRIVRRLTAHQADTLNTKAFD